MKNMMISGTFAALVGMGIAATPQTATAGVVGEYNACGAENLSVPVAGIGHTWVPVATLDATSLQGLDALVLRDCNSYSGNAAVDAAVANGMDLVLDATNISGGSVLPGAPAFLYDAAGYCDNASIPAGSPVATGPGGTLTGAALAPITWCSIMGATTISTLPSGIIPLVANADGSGAAALGYTHGAGQVAVSRAQWSYSEVYRPEEFLYAGIKTYFLNALGWALGTTGEPATTCASEGYTGTKLLWCQNICEKGYTGATLSAWLHRWTSRYRDLPYCAVK